MSDGKDIRAFLAINPPESVHEGIAHIQSQLKKSIQGAISWTRPTGIHLTLKFFGNVGQDDIDLFSEIIDKRVAGVEPLELEVKRLGVFPDARRPRVVWMGTVGDVERLSILQKNLDGDFADLGFEQEHRPFRAHWTLGRIKSPQGLTGVGQAIDWGANVSAGTFTARELILFRSELKPQGALYTRLAEYAFKG